MNACQAVRRFFTDSIRQPIERWIEGAYESCSEARRWVEREVRRPMERHRTRTERRCVERDCNWWCACCNKWFCWLESIVERFIEWIVEVIGEWLLETICRLVVGLIKIVAEIIITVVRFVAVAVVCLFTEPRSALDALIDFWYDIVDLVGAVGDLIGGVISAIGELVDITREFVLDLGARFGPLGFFFGIVAGFLDIIRRVINGIRRIVDGIFDIVTGILRLDFCAALEGLVNGVAFGLGQAIFGVTGILSLGSNGARDWADRASLESFIEGLLRERFAGEELAAVRDRLRMASSSFGADWSVQPIRCTISSRSASIDLAALHRAGEVNLFEAAGYAPIGCRETPVARSVWQLVYRDTDYRVSIGDLRAYLDGGPEAVPEFELIAGDRRVLDDMMVVARRKFRQIAVEIQPDHPRRFEIEGRAEMMLASATPLARRIKTSLTMSDICDLPGVMVFGYEPRHFGLASAWFTGTRRQPTAATVRSSFMAHLFGIVLAHEMGHCFDLRHEGHDGFENIMYTAEASAGLSAITLSAVLEYLLVGGEPRFTAADGRTAWSWIVRLAGECL